MEIRQKMQKTKATMADVARMARVSPTVAARVVQGVGYVSEEKRQRVQEAIQATGYRPNLLARSLRTAHTCTLGLVLSYACENPFFTHISHAVRTAAIDAGYSMLTVNHGYSSIAEAQGVRQFVDHRVDAVVLCHPYRMANLQPLIDYRIPIIQIERQLMPQAHIIRLDPRPGLSAAMDELCAAGHRRIAFLGGRTMEVSGS